MKRTPDGRFALLEWYELHPRSSRWAASPMFATRELAEEARRAMQHRLPEALEVVPMYRCFGDSSNTERMEMAELERRILRRGAK